jgi:hypothetical protein
MDEGDEMRPVLVSRVGFSQSCSYQRKSKTKIFAMCILFFFCKCNLFIHVYFSTLCYSFLK